MIDRVNLRGTSDVCSDTCSQLSDPPSVYGHREVCHGCLKSHELLDHSLQPVQIVLLSSSPEPPCLQRMPKHRAVYLATGNQGSGYSQRQAAADADCSLLHLGAVLCSGGGGGWRRQRSAGEAAGGPDQGPPTRYFVVSLRCQPASARRQGLLVSVPVRSLPATACSLEAVPAHA